MYLLKDMEILEMKQGSGIFIRMWKRRRPLSRNSATSARADELRANLGDLMNQRDALEQQIRSSMMNLLDSYERFESVNPLAPLS